MISRREWIIIGLVAVAVALAILFGTGLLNETLELPPRSIGVFAALVGLVVVVAILWLATLRDLARRRDGSDSRKDKKFGS